MRLARFLRYLLAFVGVVVFAVGLIVAFGPAGADLLPVDAAVERLGNDYLLLAAFAGVALAATIGALALRGVTGVAELTPPATERVASTPRLGTEFDEYLSRPSSPRSDVHGAVHERLRAAAVQTIMRTEGVSRVAARQRLADGSWTDDPEAAAYLASDSPSPLSWRWHLSAATDGETWAQRGARRAAAAVEGLTGGER